jgi:hypothetical protein
MHFGKILVRSTNTFTSFQTHIWSLESYVGMVPLRLWMRSVDQVEIYLTDNRNWLVPENLTFACESLKLMETIIIALNTKIRSFAERL